MTTYREKGTEFFKQSNFVEAARMYGLAIEEEPNEKIHYSNRSLCYLRLECYKIAKEDAEKCIKLDPTFAKGYYRQACAFYSLGEFEESLKAIKLAKKYAPNDKTINDFLAKTTKVIREKKFMEAIRSDDDEKALKETSWREMDDSDSALKIPNDVKIDSDIVMSIYNEMKAHSNVFGKCAIHKKHCLRILEEAKNILMKREVLQEIKTENKKMTIVGDIHGQFFDLIHIFDMNGYPSEDNIYLFNGDFVDRGSFGIECVLTLFSFMIAFPNSVFLARGNHETKQMNSLYGFQGEVNKKYGPEIFEIFSDVFKQLPYCHVINNSIFVVHGGIPPTFISLDDIKKIKKGDDNSQEGSIASALLWADPQTSNGSSPSIRGTGRTFGPDITHNFLERNNLQYFVRSHEMKMNGYEWGAEGKLITVFSAPNYCDQMKNKAAIIRVNSEKIGEDKYNCTLQPIQFEASPHPNIPAMCYSSFGSTF